MIQLVSYLKLAATNKFNEFVKEESGEVNIVAIVVLIGIAVLLAIIFKDNIVNLLNNLFGTINQQATNAVTNTAH